ncbi:type IV pilus modification protein PilV [Pelagibaculum spongiae]|uniref:Type IV pilus modification protein PilV n=1 Tax=Pelagibaculum spongiae TaxID=2080658 RepID=A0A2V1GYN2_9GAMM|nr:type IV pilus modification protein PilV [Pelagibaculum spongiae]PVZ70447.1 type IV pilus modification protein PilV [Pelagibaculum spongiae]
MSFINKKHSGFSLLEVLISLFIMVIGLLGMAQLQLISLQTGHGAYQRSQAAILAVELAERMRGNSDGVVGGSYRADSWDDWLSTPCAVDSDCSSAEDIAANDLFHWRSHVIAGLPGAIGSIHLVNGINVVRLQWTEQVLQDRSSSNSDDANNDGAELHEYSLPVIP